MKLIYTIDVPDERCDLDQIEALGEIVGGGAALAGGQVIYEMSCTDDYYSRIRKAIDRVE